MDKAVRKIKILIVEDTETVAAVLQAGLRQAGMDTEVASSGVEAKHRQANFQPNIVLIDLVLPDVQGFDLIHYFADLQTCGVIVVTANGEEAARVGGLDTGADDYVVKPVRVRELAARIRALHRRLQRAEEARPVGVGTEDGGFGNGRQDVITVDRTQRCLIGVQGNRGVLTEAEMAALETLLDADGASVSRESLSQVALKRPLHSEDRSVDQLVLKLRRKLSSHGASERVILSVRRQGYVIADASLFRSIPAHKNSAN